MYSRNHLSNKIKKGAYVINLDEHNNTVTHSVSLFVKTNEIPKEINKFIDSNKKNKANIFRI